MTDSKKDDIAVCVVDAARLWIGTPYRHQASMRGAGADCLGLVRGVWREVVGAEPELPPAYNRDWGLVSGEETLLTGAARHLRSLARRDPLPGDVIVFRWRDGASARHLGICTSKGRFVHAWEAAGVVESALVPAWRRRIAALFSFPERNDLRDRF